MPFITFQDVSNESIQVVKSKLNFTTETITLPRKSREGKIDKNNINSLVILGHTGEGADSMGSMNAQAFSSQLNNMIHTADRANVEHIYLIGCEAGVSLTADKVPFAKQLVDALHRNHYTNVQVHAMTNPDDQPIAGMRVEITHQIGKIGGALGEENGNLAVYINETSEQEALDLQISELTAEIEGTSDKNEQRKLKTAINRIRNSDLYQARERLVNTDDMLAELSRPQNTFTKQHPKPLAKKSLAQERFMLSLEANMRFNVKKPKLNRDLKTLLNNLRLANDDNPWQGIVNDELKKRKPKIINTSTYYDTLKTIIKNNPLVEQALKQPAASTENKHASSSLAHEQPVRHILSINNEPKPHKVKNSNPRQAELAPLLDKTFSITSNHYAYATSNRFHLFKAIYKAASGDKAKATILDEIKDDLDRIILTKDRSQLEEYVSEIKKDEKYKILCTGQGIATRFFHLDTSSKKAFDAMVEEAKTKINITFRPE